MDADRHNACYGLVLLNITILGAKWILDHKIIGRHQRFRDETGNDDIGGESMFPPPTLARPGTPGDHWPGDGVVM